MSCKCQDCGERYKVDVLIPDSLWEKIKPKGGGLLCGKCIMKRVEEISGYDAYCLTLMKVCEETIEQLLKAFNRRKYNIEDKEKS